MPNNGAIRSTIIIIVTFLVFVGLFIYFFNQPTDIKWEDGEEEIQATSSLDLIPEKDIHLKTPEAVKAVYFTNWAAGTPSFRKHMFDLFDGTILNSVVIDIKDYSGKVSIPMEDEWLKSFGSFEDRVPDIREFIEELHKKNIYVIGRVSVFQDPFLSKSRPDLAVIDNRDGGRWKDSGGMYWVDPTREEVWKYHVSIAREAHALGFDEINFDYIRFPSDGSVKTAKYYNLPKDEIVYTPVSCDGVELPDLNSSTTADKLLVNTDSNTSTQISNGATTDSKNIISNGNRYIQSKDGNYICVNKNGATSTKSTITGKSKVIKDFFSYLHEELVIKDGIPISGDLFGQVTSDMGDMGIGQVLENAMPYFDFICPMVYPSHYIDGFIGISKPATKPYEIVKYAMQMAVDRSEKASSSPMKMRPWLQAFDLGAKYTPSMIQDQIRATYDVGLNSWILWNAGSKYDKTALLEESNKGVVVKKTQIATSTIEF